MIKPNVPFEGTVLSFLPAGREALVTVRGIGEIEVVSVHLPEAFCRETPLQEGDVIYVTAGRVDHPDCCAVYAALLRRPSSDEQAN
jgi:hypothetical protein